MIYLREEINVAHSKRRWSFVVRKCRLIDGRIAERFAGSFTLLSHQSSLDPLYRQRFNLFG